MPGVICSPQSPPSVYGVACPEPPPPSTHSPSPTLLDTTPQAFVSKPKLDSFSLIADLMYVSANAGRIARALHEICLKRGWSGMAETTLEFCKCFELQLWPYQVNPSAHVVGSPQQHPPAQKLPPLANLFCAILQPMPSLGRHVDVA